MDSANELGLAVSVANKANEKLFVFLFCCKSASIMLICCCICWFWSTICSYSWACLCCSISILLASSSICCHLRSISSFLLADRYSRESDAFRLFLLQLGSDDSVDSSSPLDLPSHQVFIAFPLNLSPVFLSESASLPGIGTWESISSFRSGYLKDNSVFSYLLSEHIVSQFPTT